MTDNPQKVVVVKDYDVRRRIVALTILPAVFFASLIVGIPVIALIGINNANDIPFWVALSMTIVAELAVIVWGIIFSGFGKKWATYLKLNNFKWKYLLLGVIAGQVFYWGLQLLAWIAELTGNPVSSSDTSKSLGSVGGVLGTVILVLFVPFIVPFIEEVLFRGVIVSSLQNSKWKATWISVVVSAITFGVLHIQGFGSFTDFAIAIWITLMGGAFAYLYIKTQSLWTSIAAHSVYNLTSSVLILAGIVSS
jgi:membrane protease YdiL (CAAX protease family)